MKTSTNKYGKTVIDHAIRVELKITCEQYVFLDCIYQFNCKKKFAIASSDFEDAIGFFTRDQLKEVFHSLKESGLFITQQGKIKTSNLWNQHFINEAETITEIITYMNGVMGSSYKAEASATKKAISARLKEGYSIDNFKMVVDNRFAEWGEDIKMRQFLRPETLFGNKFESYLQHSLLSATKPITNGRESASKTNKPATNFEHIAWAYRDIPD